MKLSLPQLKLSAAIAIIFFTAPFSSTLAQSIWKGPGTDWNTATNWTGGIPGTGTNVTINAIGVYPAIGPAGGTCKTITMAAGTSVSGTGVLTISAAGTATTSGTVNIGCPLSLAGVTNLILNSGSQLTIAGIISGTGSITKSGAGTLILSGLNTYSGVTTVSAGILKLGASGSGLNSPLGTAAGATGVSSGATLDLNGYNIPTAEGLILAGTGVSSGGALTNSAAAASAFSGNISAATTTINISNGDINLGNSLTVTGILTKSGSGVLNLGSGTISLSQLVVSGTVNAASDVTITTRLTINASSVFNMSSFKLLASIGFSTAGSGEFRTASTAASSIPAGATWLPSVDYNNPSGGQIITDNIYVGGLILSNTTGTQTSSGNISYTLSLTIPNATTLDMAGFKLTGGSLSTGSGAAVDMGAGDIFFSDYSAMAGTVRLSGSNGVPINAGTVEYNGASQTIVAGDYNNLIINEASGNATLDVSAIATVNGMLTLTSGTLIIGTNTLVANGGITRTAGNLGGDYTSNLTLGGGTANAEPLYFDPSFAEMNNLILSHTAVTTTTLFTGLSIYGSITFGSSNDIADLNGQPVVLKSDGNGTAAIGQVLGTLTGATNVTAERYITDKRAWRLLTIPVSGTTIRDAWAGVAANAAAPAAESAGAGTIITGHNYSVGATAATAGFDWFAGLGSGSTSSIRFYNAAAIWASATNTPNVKLAPAKEGYMLYVRGDRTMADASSSSSTTLKPTGTIKQGSQTAAVNEAFTVVGNPYASSINLDALYSNTGNSAVINRNFWVWDATQGTSGAYLTLTWDGVGGYQLSNGDDATPYLTVNSGQAFFVEKNGPGGTLAIEESNKTTVAPLAMFRPMGTLGSGVSNLAIKLYEATGSTPGAKIDGTAARFNNIYSTATTEKYDALKMYNFNENLSLVRSGRYMSVESRPFPVQKDTLFLPFWNLKVRDYALTITSSNFAGINQTAILVDKFTNTQKVLDLSDATVTYPFTITSDPASSSLGRFIIVMAPSAPLAVNFTKIDAAVTGSQIKVSWNTGTEEGIQNYDVEKSADGVHFTKAAAVAAKNAAAGYSYEWLDKAPVNGANFYRIRSNNETGKITYSNIAVADIEVKNGILVMPTLVTGQHFTVSFNNQPAGVYKLVLTNTAGQQVFTKTTTNINGNNTLDVEFSKAQVPAGIYTLTVNGVNRTVQNCRLVIE